MAADGYTRIPWTREFSRMCMGRPRPPRHTVEEMDPPRRTGLHYLSRARWDAEPLDPRNFRLSGRGWMVVRYGRAGGRLVMLEQRKGGPLVDMHVPRRVAYHSAGLRVAGAAFAEAVRLGLGGHLRLEVQVTPHHVAMRVHAPPRGWRSFNGLPPGTVWEFAAEGSG